MLLQVRTSPSFARTAKKLHAKDKKVLDQAVNDVAGDPTIGEEKRGDLAGVFVYKFKPNKQETLLAYELSPNKLAPDEVVLLGVGASRKFLPATKTLNQHSVRPMELIGI